MNIHPIKYIIAAVILATGLFLMLYFFTNNHQANEPQVGETQSTDAQTTETHGNTGTQDTTLVFAVIGDFGSGDKEETSVATLVKSWDPAFIVTTGDGYYSSAGGTDSLKYDRSVGKDYCAYLAGITTAGTICPQPGPSTINRFYPSLGNHDYFQAGTENYLPITYTDYFDLSGYGISGNERYYDFIRGPIHFFVVNSNPGNGEEPDGVTQDSKQALWLKDGLAKSASPWNIVVFHHPPYSSGRHGTNKWMQWPFAQWGADAVLSGHDHIYERINRDGIVYFVNGAGGATLYSCLVRIKGNQYCESTFGAQKVTATDTSITFEFITPDGKFLDTFTLKQ